MLKNRFPATVSLLLAVAFASARADISFQNVSTFPDSNAFAIGELVQGTNGDFFGVTEGGGIYGKGAIFKLPASGDLSVLYSFDGTNGRAPVAGLMLGRDGWLYGTTAWGGTFDQGTVFKITPDGQFTNLVMFTGGWDNSANARCRLIQARDGNVYGTTYNGAVFRLTPDGELSFPAFVSEADGNCLYAGLVEATDGNLYATAGSGGAQGLGTVFRMTLDGQVTRLISFTGTNGAYPQTAPIQGADGCLYGTTAGGGAYGFGTVFKLTLGGELTTLASFDRTNGSSPKGVLLEATDGNIYGTTSAGGPGNGGGTLFRISPGGIFTTLFAFGEFSYYPVIYSGLMEAADGSLYGLNSRDASIYRVTGVNAAPAIAVPPASQILPRGAVASLGASANITGLACQWLLNGSPIPAATNLTWAATIAGDYQLLASNRLGTATSAVAKVTFWDFARHQGQAMFTIEGQPGSQYRLEATTNWVAWEPVTNLTLLESPFSFGDSAWMSLDRRFYRLRLEP